MVKIDSWALPSNTEGHPHIEVSNSSIKINSEELEEVKNFHLKSSENDKVSVSSTNGAMVYAGTLPIPTLDTTDLRDGWLYHKTATGSGKFNYYLYANSNSSHQYTFADLKTVNFTASTDIFSSITSIPFIVVYSKPTGSGDAGAFYHSARKYLIDLTKINIVGGEQINFYCGEKIKQNNNNRYVELSFIINEGDNLETEEILWITIHSDSSALINTKILMTHFGYNLKNEVIRNVKLC